MERIDLGLGVACGTWDSECGVIGNREGIAEVKAGLPIVLQPAESWGYVGCCQDSGCKGTPNAMILNPSAEPSAES